MNSEETKQFSHDELWEALRESEDFLDRCVAPVFLVGQTAKDMAEDVNLSGDKIEWAIQKKDLTESTLAMMKTLKPEAQYTEAEISYKVKGVPVTIKIINNHYAFFEHRNKKQYLAGDYEYPNPFEKYYKARFIVK